MDALTNAPKLLRVSVTKAHAHTQVEAALLYRRMGCKRKLAYHLFGASRLYARLGAHGSAFRLLTAISDLFKV